MLGFYCGGGGGGCSGITMTGKLSKTNYQQR